MKNSIDVQAEFSFKGEDYSLSATIDLDECLEKGGIPSFYEILAKKNRIDTYSYLYEVMEQSELFFGNAKGLASDFLHEGNFDLDAFALQWRENEILSLLDSIAREMGIDDLAGNPKLRSALYQAYCLGKSDV